MVAEKTVTSKKYRSKPNQTNWIIVKILEEACLLDRKKYKTNKNTLNTMLYSPEPKQGKPVMLYKLIELFTANDETELNKWKETIAKYTVEYKEEFKREFKEEFKEDKKPSCNNLNITTHVTTDFLKLKQNRSLRT